MKKISKLMIVMLILVTAIFALTACPANNDEVSEILVSEAGMPRLEFVQGQDYDFFGGQLTVIRNGKEEFIALDSPDLTVTGYDKNKIGEQTVTISYGGVTTTLTVNVVKRISVNIEQNDLKYFVGESFDSSKGSFVLTYDDGTKTDSISLSDPAVTIGGLASFAQSAGENMLTISYNGYSDTFSVNVSEPASVSFNVPNKTSYESHDTTFDLTGGYFTFRDAVAVNDAGSGVTKIVTLTSGMISGFNPALCTYEGNYLPNEELKQEITVSYAGKPYKFNIYIKYSDISLIKHYADTIANAIDFNALTASEVDGGAFNAYKDIANSAANKYFELVDKVSVLNDAAALEKLSATEVAELEKLSEDLDKIITTQELCSIMPIAAYDAYNKWFGYFEQCSSFIGFTQDYTVSLIADTYENAKNSLSILNGTSEAASAYKNSIAYNELLWKILGDSQLKLLRVCKTEVEGTEVILSISDICTYAVSQSSIESNILSIKYAVEMYDLLKDVKLSDVKDGWANNANAKANNVDSIKSVYNRIYTDANTIIYSRSLYSGVLNVWNKSFLDILFQYYYNEAVADMAKNPSHTDFETNESLYAMILLGYCTAFPDIIETFYAVSQSAFSELATNNQYEEMYGTGVVVDSSTYFYYYRALKNISDQVLNLPDESEYELYRDILALDGMGFFYSYFTDDEGYPYPVSVEEVIDSLDYYYLYYATNMAGSLEYEDMLDDFVYLVGELIAGNYYTTIINDDGTYSYNYTEAFKTDIPAFFKKFITYSKTAQTNFLLNVSSYASMADYLLLDMNGEYNFTYFSALINSYYIDFLDEDQFDVFNRLMIAYECYLRNGTYEDSDNDIDAFWRYFRDGYVVYNKDGTEIEDEINGAEEDYLRLTDAQKADISFLYDYLKTIADEYYKEDENGTRVSKVIKFADFSGWTTDETAAKWENKFLKVANAFLNLYTGYVAGNNYDAYAPFMANVLLYEKLYNELYNDIIAVEDASVKNFLVTALDYVQLNNINGYVDDTGLGDAFAVSDFYYYTRSYYSTLMLKMPAFSEFESLYVVMDDSLKDKLIASADIFASICATRGDSSTYKLSNLYDVEGADEFFMSFISGDGWTDRERALWVEFGNYSLQNDAQIDFFTYAFIEFYFNELGYDRSSLSETSSDAAVFYALSTFIDMISTKITYNYYLDNADYYKALAGSDYDYDTDLLSVFSSDYQQAAANFRSYYNALSDAQKAVFDAKFGDYFTV